MYRLGNSIKDLGKKYFVINEIKDMEIKEK